MVEAQAFTGTLSKPGAGYSTESGERNSQAVAPSIQVIVDKIYQLESSSGKFDKKCERIGMHNGFGYGQTINSNTCFKSDTEARDKVVAWVTEKQKDHSLPELLCLYNLGVPSEHCDYSDKFFSLNS